MAARFKDINIIFTTLVITGLLVALCDASDGSCSLNEFLTCHDEASCVDDFEANTFDCVCPTGSEGDGLKGLGNTGCGPRKCKLTGDCHTLAVCSNVSECQCTAGYTGDGWQSCVDVNECNGNKANCSQDATCENTDGSYRCTCKVQEGFVGDGFTCEHKCTMDVQCEVNERCNLTTQDCECQPGYEQGVTGCVDVNECTDGSQPCDINAVCVNGVGNFTCTCNNGYSVDGMTCTAMPRNCHDIKLALPNSRSNTYEIDPDFTGPLGVIEVECEMRPQFGITIIYPNKTSATKVTVKNPTLNITYTQPMADIKAIIATSGFCYQDIKYLCKGGAMLMDGDDFWVNANNVPEENWGGSSTFQKCACGELGSCPDTSARCNCNGTTATMVDDGKIVDKTKLPILSVTSDPGPNGFGAITVGSVMCANTSFDFPLNCHDAKFNTYYKIKVNGPQFIDVDGPNGVLEPVLAYCDVETYSHVGITTIPHLDPLPVDIPKAGEYPISYTMEQLALDTLVSNSVFCMQEASYECTNSRLLNNGDKKGYFSDQAGNSKDYWPGGMGEAYQCACNLTDKCADVTFGCNCDVVDGKTRRDFGRVIDKNDLPIGSVTFTEIGGDKIGKYYVGPLMCSDREFGIPATCQGYIQQGYTESHTYLIDTDGPFNSDVPDNQPPFPVYCEIVGEPAYAITIVYHYTEQVTVTENGIVVYIYRHANKAQLLGLIERSVTCTQKVKYMCQKAPLHSGSEALTTWQTLDGRSFSYFAGDGEQASSCACGLEGNCTGGGSCNCDLADILERVDEGVLLNKDDLPIASATFTDIGGMSSEATLEIGPLMCKELFPNCAEQNLFNKANRLESEDKIVDGFYMIDADGHGGVEPFVVECINTKTIIHVVIEPNSPGIGDPDEPVSSCYDINYKSNGKLIDKEKVNALVTNSKFCAQQLSQDCQNAPLTGHSNFTTCDGVEQKGWAGSRGEEKCACGVTGTCAGGPEEACNCDLVDGNWYQDGGLIVDKARLAVCKVCVSLDPTNSLASLPKERHVIPEVSDLFCDSFPIGTGKSCQYWRDGGMVIPGTQMLDPDGRGSTEPSPFYCGFEVYPPTGWTSIIPKTTYLEIPFDGIDITIEYYVYSMEILYTLIEKSGYCTQELWLECIDSGLELGGVYGWYSKDGNVQSYWAGNEKGTPGCDGGECQCNLGGLREDGGLIIDKNLMPISRIKLGQANGTRNLTIGPVKCYDIYKDCEDIRKNKAKTNPMGDQTYTIDPDQAGGVPYFAVVCDFKTDKRIGITIIRVILNDTVVLPPDGKNDPIVYDSVTYEQIHVLASISGFCLQGIEYECKMSPLMGGSDPRYGYYNGYGNEKSSSFGVAGHPETEGCACVVSKSCPEGYNCQCDQIGSMTITVDYGYETDKSVLPIQMVNFGNQSAQSQAVYDLTDIRCARTPFDLPKNCDEAHHKYEKYTGEVLIWPSENVAPFIVRCDMDIVEDGGVTIIGNDFEEGVPVPFNAALTVTYHNAMKEQVDALTAVSSFCYQPFKYECRNTKLLSGQTYFYWQGGIDDAERRFIGAGDPVARQCNCGSQGFCGGNETMATLMALKRPCNCDAGDAEDRADAGVFTSSNNLPIEKLTFLDVGLLNPYGFVKLGKLYCSEKVFDIDECTIGFHDCHANAKCINKPGYYNCECRPGYQGLGRVDDAWANGRNCYDDDECAMNLCPWNADCTNLPGDFECTCYPGFKKTGKRTCEDINECDNNATHQCSPHGTCMNIAGSYDCRCNLNYHGDGFSCELLARCACFGDPHCISSDGKLIDYQGACQYVMSRDRCDDFAAKPTFELLITNDNNVISSFAPISWVKEVTLKIHNFTVILKQGNEILVNDYKVNLPFTRDTIAIRQFGQAVDVYTDIGVQLSWDGHHDIELYTPAQFFNQTCGICGNFNGVPEDDLIIGPACPANETEQAENFNIFGDSWVNPAYVALNPTCAANCSAAPDSFNCTAQATAELVCDKVYGKNGVFKECFVTMDASLYAQYKYACEYDLCRIDGDTELAICESANRLAKTCLDVFKVSVTWRSAGFCEINCKENMENICGSPNQMTCLEYLTNTTVNITEASCREGCFCKEGFMLNGAGDCVMPEECGCYYNDMIYAIGDEVTLVGCSEQVVCLENGTMEVRKINCHKFAVCKLKRGRYGCHCKKHFYGDGIEMCETDDACLKNPCGVNETCTINPDVGLGYECTCQMGFMGDCGECVEIDECLTATDNCPYFSKCINTVGSFKCECLDGFTMFGGKCQDLNECNLEKINGNSVPVCGNNSRCSNKIGSFECPCCEGFDKVDGECVESPSAPPGPVCCVCDTANCKDKRKVCGEDGHDYDSIRDMIISNCEKGIKRAGRRLQVDYYGPCKGNCYEVTCPLYQHCIQKQRTGKPTCICDSCSDEEKNSSTAVCTNKKQYYPNMCAFKQDQCKFDAQDTPRKDMKPCLGKNGDKPVGEWSIWSECSVTCGKGVSLRTRPSKRLLTAAEKEALPLEMSKDCYKDDCPDSPCWKYDECNIAAECVENADGTPYCECPSCENIEEDPVCGYVAGIEIPEIDWQSACILQKFACENNASDYLMLNKGPCADEPRNCTRIPNAPLIKGGDDDEYVSENGVDLYDCDGGCGDVRYDCCQPTVTEQMNVKLVNVGIDPPEFIYKSVVVIKKCECIDIGNSTIVKK